MARTERRRRGDAGEERACRHLVDAGLRLREAGWQCRLGELDLVMQDQETLVFVEVRYRQSGSLVSAVESIDGHKRRRFERAARAWLANHPADAALPARFDVVAIAGDELEWIRNAMEASPR